ncbi:excisionase [Luteimonas sp. BDR2-5]|uniref:excisionase n=1 Tax=Proluteimonas luteida TaxID=2878685 RepID=UPI001E586EC8|nr:excisionase [Luteimonas sp. BDR2-5]MCD9029398.1 excisionase [Luteimonas sp. BDR2-5]
MSVRFVTLKRFHELTGYSEEASRSKIKRGDWLQDREFVKAPDGRVLMDLEAYEQWVLGEAGEVVLHPCARSRIGPRR